MIRFTRSQLQPIGVDLGLDSIKMLQLEVSGNQLSVVAAARREMPASLRSDPCSPARMDEALTMVRRMVREEGFRGRRVVICVPREMLHVKNVRLPQMPLAELEAAIGFEARNLMPFPPEQAMIRCIPAGEVRQGAEIKQEAIVLGARSGQIDELIERVHRHGLIVAGLDVEACALFRTIERFIRRREDEQEVHVLLDVGARRSLVAIGRGREISFIKPIDIGGDQLSTAVSAKLGISFDEAQALRRRLIETAEPPEGGTHDSVRQAVGDAVRGTLEALVQELSLCLRYYSVTFRGQRPAKVRILGGGGTDEHLRLTLAGSLNLPVEQGRPLFSVDTAKMKRGDRRGTMSEWAMALGLALKCTSGTFAPRDGKPRDPGAPRPDLETPGAEVVDLGALLGASPHAPAEPSASERRDGAVVETIGLTGGGASRPLAGSASGETTHA